MASVDPSTPQTPLPFCTLALLCLCNLTEAFQMNVIWSFVPFMVSDFGFSEDHIGEGVGAIGSVYFLAQFFSNIAWGYFADNYGRRPTLLAGLLCTGTCLFGFGTSSSFEAAIFWRWAMGTFNGNVAITKTYLGEVTDRTNQAKGFSYLAFSWGFGCIVAPAIGGFLSQPTQKYPAVFGEDSLFGKHPYLLPCAVCSSVSLVGLLCGIVLLPETAAFRRKRDAYTAVPKIATAQATEISTQVGEGRHTKPHAVEPDLPDAQTANSKNCGLVGAVSSLHAVWCCPEQVRCILLYGLTSFQWILFEELFPVFCAFQGQASVTWGQAYAFNTNEVGFALMIGGIILMPYQLLVFPSITKALGALRSYRYAASNSTIFCLCFVPLSLLSGRIFTGTPWKLWVSVAVMQAWNAIIRGTQFSSIMILINNVSVGQRLALINGIAQSTSALFRTLGPSLGGALWSWGLSLSWLPLHESIPYALMASTGLATLIGAAKVPLSANAPRVDPAESIDEAAMQVGTQVGEGALSNHSQRAVSEHKIEKVDILETVAYGKKQGDDPV